MKKIIILMIFLIACFTSGCIDNNIDANNTSMQTNISINDDRIDFDDLNETELTWCADFMGACANGETFDFDNNPAPSTKSLEFVIQLLEDIGY